jgi:hypothetical protein
VQNVVAGELVEATFTPPVAPTVTLQKAAMEHLVERAHTLARHAARAEAEAQSRATLRIKELQDQVARLQADVHALGLELDGKQDASEQRLAQAKARTRLVASACMACDAVGSLCARIRSDFACAQLLSSAQISPVPVT